jgi:hypothetical protein
MDRMDAPATAAPPDFREGATEFRAYLWWFKGQRQLTIERVSDEERKTFAVSDFIFGVLPHDLRRFFEGKHV